MIAGAAACTLHLVTHTAGRNLASDTEKHLPRQEEWSLKCAFSQEFLLPLLQQSSTELPFPCPRVEQQPKERRQLSQTLFQLTCRRFMGQIVVFNIQEGMEPGWLSSWCAASHCLSLSLLPFSLPRLQEDPPTGVSGAPSENNIMLWNAVIFGWVRRWTGSSCLWLTAGCWRTEPSSLSVLLTVVGNQNSEAVWWKCDWLKTLFLLSLSLSACLSHSLSLPSLDLWGHHSKMVSSPVSLQYLLCCLVRQEKCWLRLVFSPPLQLTSLYPCLLFLSSCLYF